MFNIEHSLNQMEDNEKETERLVKEQPIQKSLITEINRRVLSVNSTKIPYMVNCERPFNRTTVIGPGPNGYGPTPKVKTMFPGLLIKIDGNHSVKNLVYVSDNNYDSPVRGGDEIIAKVVAEEYIKLPTPHYPPKPTHLHRSPEPITHVRQRGSLVETMQAVEIQILDANKNIIRTDKGLFPQNPHELC